MERRGRGSHGWDEVSRERRRDIIAAIVENRPTRGPVHAELDLTDRCNVACYFCNQQDTRTSQFIPYERACVLIDELAGNGLRSVRLSGGGDPLFHREINQIFDRFASHDIVVDNLTTNGVALNADVRKRLIDGRAREVIVSLNAVDAADYHRMLRVKPALFDKVVENARSLVQERGDAQWPAVVIQFLLDRENYMRLPEMYDLARGVGVDRIAVNVVLEIPRERIDHDKLLAPGDRELVRPYLREVLQRDADARLLQIDFAIAGWNVMIAEERERTGHHPQELFGTAPSFRDENGGCFFAWYTTTIVGNGDIHPCCLLIPNGQPLGNVHQGSFSEQWNGPAFAQMRNEMRSVLVDPVAASKNQESFSILKAPCLEPGLCWLKNMYFRADEEFYSELATALDQVRSQTGADPHLAAQPGGVTPHPSAARRLYDVGRNATRPLRIWLKQRFGINVTRAV